MESDRFTQVLLRSQAVCVRLAAQLCPTLCDLKDCSLPVSTIHGEKKIEYWSGLPFPPPGDPPDPGIEPMSPALQADSLPTEPSGKPPISGRTLNKCFASVLSFIKWKH